MGKKDLLSDIFDVLACNTDFVTPDEIEKRFDVEVDFDNLSISLFKHDDRCNAVLTLKVQ